MDSKLAKQARRAFMGLAMAGAWCLCAHAQAAPSVQFQTSAGDFVIELNAEKAPKTVENFLQYVNDKHYEGTVFHRVIDGFMVHNDRGTIAMARSGNPNSATAQFFVNVVDNPGLNAPQPDGFGYAVFGKVSSGMETIDKIRALPTGNKSGMQNVPLTPITINSVRILK